MGDDIDVAMDEVLSGKKGKVYQGNLGQQDTMSRILSAKVDTS